MVGLLNGRRTVAQAWQIVCDQLDDATPTQGEVVHVLGQLYTHNLLEADLPLDTQSLFKRQRKRVRREVGGYFMNILFAKMPLFDPDRLLDRWVGPVGWVFGPVGWVLWAVLMVLGVRSLLGRWDALADQAQGVLAPSNLLWLYVALVGIKAIHEAGHAFACKRLGQQAGRRGEVHTIGIMLMVFTPVPYVDATSSWALPSKWQRAFIAAAGMYLELAVAAVAAIVWSNTTAGTAIHAVAYNLIFVAGVSTILFNANPLIKFDGYFILSDLLESPNLYQRSQKYLGYLFKRYLYGVRHPQNPAHTGGERPWLVIYGLSSAAYKVFLAVVIALFVAEMFFIIGVLMAILALVTFLGVPMGKLVKYLFSSPELSRVRPRALMATSLGLGLPIAALAMIPAPDRPRATGVVEAHEVAYVHAGADGELQHVLATGTLVDPAAAPLLFDARNIQLYAKRQELQARRRKLDAQYGRAREQGQALKEVVAQQIAAVDDMLADVEQRIAGLQAYPPIAGTWVSEQPDGLQGAYVRQGDPIGYVATLDHLQVRVAANQFQGPQLAKVGAEVKVRIQGNATHELTGVVTQVMPAGRRALPSAALGLSGGGDILIDPTDPQGLRAAEPFFELLIAFDASERTLTQKVLRAGQRVCVRFELAPRPLLGQWYHEVRQVLQRRFEV